MKEKKGWIILNKEGNFGWDYNTEFHENFEIAGERSAELTLATDLEFRVVPATLTYDAT